MSEMTAHPTQPVSAGTGGKIFPLSLSGLSLATVNRLLMILALVALVYFSATLLFGMFKLMGVHGHIRSLEAKGAKTAAASMNKEFMKAAPVDPALENRNAFQPAGAGVSTTSVSADTGTESTYRLVGISEAKDTAETYVMVENSKTKLTYFLQYGQPVEGMELEKILEDKVIVKIGGKSVELK